ncbi:MAG: S8 family serine peptidase [Chiayiivirga sp.]|nr:S8 family serine peptidase [Chiayiivirga sp.]
MPPPLAGLTAESPDDAEYLLPRRAAGAFKEFLDANPTSARARLERYVVIHYSSGSNLVNARNALMADPNVEYAHVPPPAEFALPPATSAQRLLAASAFAQSATDWSTSLDVVSAWQLAGGWSLVGTVDNGIATAHPDLRAFANGQYVGGNYLAALSYDVGRTGIAGCQAAGNCIEPNPDEAQPVTVAVGGNCDPDGDGQATPTSAGHGTHVAGLIGARGTSAQGVCRHCGVTAWRVAREICLQTGNLFPQLNPAAIDAAITIQADIGVQVINQSFVRATLLNPAHCQQNPNASECVALQHAAERGVMLVAAAGNNRTAIAFPANQTAMVASSGGLGTNLALWNRDPDAPPNHLDQCPQPPLIQQVGQECGSNFTINVGVDRRQEVTTPAEAVHSTTYPGLNWNPGLGCGDAIGGPNGDGVGACTGTSMASPITAGLGGLLRSINPLVLPGDPENAADAVGIRDVVAATTHAAQDGQPWTPQLGYGRPDAAAAARRMLGTVRGVVARNRATPLFDFHSAAATDFASTATPQVAMTLAITQPWVWAPRGPAIAGYGAYPIAPNATMPAPHASAYVLTTEYRTDPSQPPTTPLYLLSRSRPWPLGCTPGTMGCNGANRDFVLMSSEADVQTAVADGYEFQGRQGHIFQRCAAEPGCIPAGASRLYRQCNATEDDCAVFLEHELATFQAQGYNAPYPAGSNPVIGYAYRNIDGDGDGLIDGFERLIGTNSASADSDGDGIADAVEYPLAGVPVSDPCAGPAVTCTQSIIFYDGFE